MSVLRALRRLAGRRDEPGDRPPLRQEQQALLAQVCDVQHWRELLPGLGIDEQEPELPGISLPPGFAPAALERLRTEGYLQLDGMFAEAEIEGLRSAVETLHTNGWPAVFVFLYDQTWRVLRRLSPMLTAVLGPAYRQLPDFWAWRLDPRSAGAGWKRHRDKGFRTLEADRAPRSLTVWLALTEATPLNGCLYALPADRDPDYGVDYGSTQVADLQDVRALPVPAGSLLCWTQALLHWGGRSSPRAAGPRISLSCELQRGDVEPMNVPLLDPRVAPGFEHRLQLIALQARQYRHFEALSPTLEALVTSLAEDA